MLERTKNSLRSGDKLKSVVSGLPVRFVKWVDRDTGLFEGEVYQRGYTRPMGYKSDEFNIRFFNMYQRNTNLLDVRYDMIVERARLDQQGGV